MRRRLAQKFKSLFRLSRKPSPGGVVETSGIAPLTVPAPIVPASIIPASHNPPVQELDETRGVVETSGIAPPTVPAPIVPASHNPPVQELDETRGVTLVGLRDLWQEAFNKLHPDTRSKLQSLAGDQLLATTNISHNITNLLDEIDNKRRKGEEETWKCVVEGQEIVLRDYAVKLVDGLKLAGDIAVEFVPGPAKLVWLVLKGFMTVTVTNSTEQMAALLTCSERLVRSVAIGRTYENSYISADRTTRATQQLQDDLTKMYGATLKILADAENLFSKGTCGKTLHAVLFPHQTLGLVSDLADQEAAVDRAAHACGSEVDKAALEFFVSNKREAAIRILNSITPNDPEKQHETAKSGRTVGTCQWLLDTNEFKSWLNVSASSIVCLEGSPGTGKTVLTSSVVDYFKGNLAKSPRDALAFFYCKRTETPRPDLTSILQAFVRQLSSRALDQDMGSTWNRVVSFFKNPTKQTMDKNDCKTEILAATASYAVTTIVLDGFDECEKGLQENLQDLFEWLIKTSERPVKIFVSSRPSAIRNLGWARVCISQTSNGADVEKYITERIDDRHTLPILKTMKSEVLSSLLLKGASMFKWVQLQLAELLKCESEESIRDHLKSMPETLDGTYDEIYKAINLRNRWDRGRAERAIKWVMCSKRQLKVHDLLDVIRIDTDQDSTSSDWLLTRVDEKAVVSLCNDLLTVDRERGVWVFPHLSVLEYFEKQMPGSGRPNRQAGEECAARASLWVLTAYPGYKNDISPTVTRQIEASPADGPRDAPPQPGKPDRLGTWFKEYAVSYWASHVQAVERGNNADASTALTARLLKIFLGSPSESSEKYCNWYLDALGTPGGKSLAGGGLRGLLPIDQSIFAMATMGFFYLLQDWWEDLNMDVNLVNEDGHNLLVLAAMSGSVPTCRRLVERGLQVDAIVGLPPSTMTALAAAAYRGKLEVVKHLVEDSAATIELSISGGDFTSALEAASKAGNLCIVRYLVKKKPKLSLGTALTAAASTGGYDTVQFLLDAGADVNGQSSSGEYGSALAAAAAGAFYHVTELLIKKGAEVDQELVRGTYGSALAAAVRHPVGLSTIELLIRSGADLNLVLKNGAYHNALFAALNFDDFYDNFQYLISRGASFNSMFTSDIPATVLAHAICSNRQDLLDDLTRDGEPDLQRVVQEGILVPALVDALCKSRRDVVEALVQAGADVNATLWDNWLGSCLEVAASGDSEGDTEDVAFLIELGARVNLSSKRGIFGCPLAVAAGLDNSEMVAFLLKNKADPNLRSTHAFLETPLMMAAFVGAYNCAEALLKAGADANLSVDRGKFPDALHVAESQDLGSGNDEDDWWRAWAMEDDDILNGRKEVNALLQRWRDESRLLPTTTTTETGTSSSDQPTK